MKAGTLKNTCCTNTPIHCQKIIDNSMNKCKANAKNGSITFSTEASPYKDLPCVYVSFHEGDPTDLYPTVILSYLSSPWSFRSS